MTQGLVSLALLLNTTLINTPAIISPLPESFFGEEKQEEILATQKLNLDNRYDGSFVNQVFKDNIILSLHYLGGREKDKTVDWEEIRKPGLFAFTLNPGEVFAFHANVLPEYEEMLVQTMNSNFFADEGYKNSGFIFGDGVCHLASLINWVATDAGLQVKAKVNHNFRLIPDIPKEYGTSIKYSENGGNSQNQNLYVQNNKSFPIEFRFTTSLNDLDLAVVKK
ncbi:VanW family protein [Patescibacteria group bacterium]